MLIGYVRVSTNDQNTALQRTALECAGCELIFEDKISGKTSERPGLKRVLKTLGKGGYACGMETRSLWVQHAASCPAGRGVAGQRYQFSQPDRQYRYVNANGTFLFHVMGALAEMERELIVERTRAALAAAKAQGRMGGRRPKFTSEQWEQMGRLIAAGESRQRVALIFDAGISTFYRRFPASSFE